MDLIKKVIREMLLEEAEAENSQQNQQQGNQAAGQQAAQQQANGQQQVQQVKGQQQNQQQQAQQVKNDFNQISGMLASLANNGASILNNAKQMFTNGVNGLAKCTDGFDKKFKNSIGKCIDSLEGGNAELKKMDQLIRNIQQLSENIANKTGGNQGGK